MSSRSGGHLGALPGIPSALARSVGPEIAELIEQVKAENPSLGRNLETEVHQFTRRHLGLFFERHDPEEVEMAGSPIRKGAYVRLQPWSGASKADLARLWTVTALTCL